MCAPGEADIILQHLQAVGLPTRPTQVAGPSMTAADLLAHMAQDKKVSEGKVTFVLAEGIGKACLKRDVADTDVLAVLEAALANSGS